MNRAILPFLLAGSLAAFAQSKSAEVSESAIKLTPEAQAPLIRLGGQLMVADKAYEYDRVLADEIGPRLTGSGNYVKAVEWASSEFKRLGATNVHTEAWDIPATWEPETTGTARIITPHEQRLHLESEGWSPSTPAGGVRGKVFYLKDVTAETVKAAAPQIKDAIVLIDFDGVASHIQDGFGKLFDSLDLISAEGARGQINGFGVMNNAISVVGDSGFTGRLGRIPSGNLGQEDTLLLKSMLQSGPVEVEFSFTNHVREHVKVDNVVAEISGSDKSGEYVLVGAHLDSWHPGTGAQDNGTGAASVVAIAEAIKALGLTPRRTIRFVLFGGEEEGTLGSVQYARQHVAEGAKCVGVFVTDSGAEPPLGWLTFGRSDERQAIAALREVLAPLGASGTDDGGEGVFETDESPFLVQGIPAFVLWTPTEKYMAIHHKAGDTFDKVNQRDLNLGAAVVGMTAYAFADSPTALKHYSTAEIEEQLKSIKAWVGYKDMQDHHMF